MSVTSTALIHGLCVIYKDGSNCEMEYGLLWPSVFSADRNLTARVTLRYVPMPALPSTP